MRCVQFLAPAALGLALAACEPQATVEEGPPDAPETPEAPEQPEAPETPADALGGVDLAGDISLTGTEPFWSVRFAGDEVIYEGLDRPRQYAPRPEPMIAGPTATWTTETDQGNALVVTLIADPQCSDGMSDRVYPLRARVEISGETLMGCAGSTEWFMNTDERGQPRAG